MLLPGLNHNTKIEADTSLYYYFKKYSEILN